MRLKFIQHNAKRKHYGVATLLASASLACQGAVLQFEAKGTSLVNSSIRSNWNFVGLMGDFIELKDGAHDITFDGPRGYKLRFKIMINDNKASISNVESDAPNCQPALNVNWPMPTVTTSQSWLDVISVGLQEPQFGAPTGMTSCSAALMAGCTKRKIVMDANTSPPGAEIWIDGEKQEARTNVVLSVPYCQYERSKQIVLRAPNVINCTRSVDLVPDAKVEVACTLRVALAK